MSARVAVLVYVEPEIKAALQEIADANYRTLSQEGRRALMLYLATDEEE